MPHVSADVDDQVDLATTVTAALRCQHVPVPSREWLRALIASRHPPPPLAALTATARIRLLNLDLRTPNLLDPQFVADACLPADIASPHLGERTLPSDVVVQVLDVENVSRSRWEQVEELEAVGRGELTRGREVVRLPTGAAADEDMHPGSDVATQPGREQVKKATHKLLLQDCSGQKVYALELTRVEKVAIGKTNMGEKMVLKAGTKVARGIVLLQPANCLILGGKMDTWHKAWLQGRLASLKEAAREGSD